MLSYTRVTDIVRHADELEVLRNAIDNVEQGVVLISEALLIQFVNKKAQSYWGLTPEQFNNKLTIADYIAHVRKAGLYGVPNDALDDYVVKRVTMIKTGDQTPIDIPVQDGRTIRAQCTSLIGGGRMLTYTDVTDLVQRAEQQELLATTDVLTGLHNRRHFLVLASAEWDRFRRYGSAFSILFLDIDNFKAINDRLGHEAGDRAIMRVAAVCNRARRASDIVARMGGDEFVLLLPETKEAAAIAFAERLHSAIGCERLDVDGVCINVTVSIGIAHTVNGVPDVTQLLKVADARLYRAKAAGRNRIVWDDGAECGSRASSALVLCEEAKTRGL
jgi:diguanylate cyclase (GGDEF)-like protein